MKTVKAWCVKTPVDQLVVGSTTNDMDMTIEYAVMYSGFNTWAKLRNLGYTVVPVEIREVKDEQES